LSLLIICIEYITTLEGQVNEHKQENQDLLDKLNQIEEENKQLKIQLETLKCQNTQLLSSDSTYQDTSILVS
jgi:regulator of replication initiation timing